MPRLKELKQTVIFSILLLSAGIPGALYSQERAFSVTVIEKWFSSEKAKPYLPVKEDILSLFKKAEQAALPPEVLRDKLYHGAARAVSPEKLVEALELHYKRMEEAGEILSPWEEELQRQPEKRDVGIKNLVIYLSSGETGIDAPALKTLSLRARTAGRNLEDLYGISEFTLKLLTLTDLPPGEVLAFSRTLLSSSMARESWTAIPSLFLRGSAWNISAGETLMLFTNVLKNGGGILQMEREIQRRRKR